MEMSRCPQLFQPLDSYTATKSEGEAGIIKVNGTNGLLTCSLRPSGIFGPGERLFHLRLLQEGLGNFIIGDGNNIYDFTYVENVALAHICAERALASGGEVAEKVAGQEGLKRTLESFSHLRAKSQPNGGPSNAHRFLGGGRGTSIHFLSM
ncbi:hypothetical protein GH714_037560 [Hevea brasiliensis]|uniref:3-beta hydroxysteroid dehydrogenase/isomerase domain-containing protein n=1 Tax=Hevea brasiliensis TaxID=3981 RepID=A0A6A6KAB1_HEVBR|nr:hypothetical protein GH714_037560 [Hevea brasiliensis]